MEEETSQKETSEPKKEKNTGMAIIAYIVFFIPLLTEAKNDPFVKYHVKQGLVLFICGIVLSIVFNVIPYLWFFSWICNIFILVLVIMGIMNAVNGKQKPLPVIGKLAEKFKF